MHIAQAKLTITITMLRNNIAKSIQENIRFNCKQWSLPGFNAVLTLPLSRHLTNSNTKHVVPASTAVTTNPVNWFIFQIRGQLNHVACAASVWLHRSSCHFCWSFLLTFSLLLVSYAHFFPFVLVGFPNVWPSMSRQPLRALSVDFHQRSSNLETTVQSHHVVTKLVRQSLATSCLRLFYEAYYIHSRWLGMVVPVEVSYPWKHVPAGCELCNNVLNTVLCSLHSHSGHYTPWDQEQELV